MEWLRSATKASCSSARQRAWAWTLPVATQRTESRRASACQGTVAGAVVTVERALELDVEALRAEGVEQPAGERLVVSMRARRRHGGGAVEHRARGAAAQADETLGVVDQPLHVQVRLAEVAATAALAGVGVGEREDPAEVAPAAPVAHEQREVPGGPLAAEDVHLGALDRPHPVLGSGLGQLHRAADGVVIGQRERGVAELPRTLGELVGQGGPVQE